MATNMLRHLLVLALAFQGSSLHARSLAEDYDDTRLDTTTQGYTEFPRDAVMPSDYDTLDDAFLADLDFPIAPLLADSEWNTEPDMPSLAKETDAWGDTYNLANENDASVWDPFTIHKSEPSPRKAEEYSTTFASTESELSYDTNIDSAASIDPITNADDTAYIPKGIQLAYEDDEVYFDTSDADIVYKASDDGLSLSAADVMNATSADGTLASLAKAMGGCGTYNPIDDCWRCDADWRSHRKALASCVTGFGRDAVGGKNGPFYIVTDNSDDAQNPSVGTLRYGLIQPGPLWIIFGRDMTIKPVAELFVTAYKTIDGRGAEVHIVGAQISIKGVTNVIVHGIYIHDIVVTGPSTVRISPTKVKSRSKTDGDGLCIFNSQNVWVDHCYLANATDGLLDATRGSNMITVSNNLFENHNKVMLFGSSPDFPQDRNMRATVSYNRFGRRLVQRLPRCRFGVFHIVNNHYAHGWGMYAIGGSQDPMILSQGNVFNAGKSKEVTKRIDDGGPTFGGWKKWNWASSGDVFVNRAYFTGSGAKASKTEVYAKGYSTAPRPASLVPAMTSSAGPILTLP